MSQLSFASLTPKKKRVLRAETFLSQMEKVVPWKEIVNLIKPHYYNNTTGRQAYDLLVMVKIYCLQQWYNLADAAMEEAIYDRRSFSEFLKIDLMLECIPDETTILNFRHLLEKHQMGQKLLDLVNRYLESKGMVMKKGTLVDATIIEAPKSTKNEEGKRDPEMSSTKKGNQWYFGMKMHVGADMNSGLVQTCVATTASVSDRDVFEELLHGEELAIIGDKGYVNKKDKRAARQAGIFWGVLDRPGRPHKLSTKQEKRNALLSKIRAKVEHPFRVVKHLWGHVKTRYRGLYKNGNQLTAVFALCNLYMARRMLLS